MAEDNLHEYELWHDLQENFFSNEDDDGLTSNSNSNSGVGNKGKKKGAGSSDSDSDNDDDGDNDDDLSTSSSNSKKLGFFSRIFGILIDLYDYAGLWYLDFMDRMSG